MLPVLVKIIFFKIFEVEILAPGVLLYIMRGYGVLGFRPPEAAGAEIKLRFTSFY